MDKKWLIVIIVILAIIIGFIIYSTNSNELFSPKKGLANSNQNGCFCDPDVSEWDDTCGVGYEAHAVITEACPTQCPGSCEYNVFCVKKATELFKVKRYLLAEGLTESCFDNWAISQE